jgi:hypothetical protein
MTPLAALVLACATAPADRLPAGALFEAPPALIEAARKHVAAFKDPMLNSPYEPHDFPLFMGRRIEWSDGSAVDVSCGVKATLSRLEKGRFTLKKASTRAVQPPYKGMRPWRELVYELEDVEMGFPVTVTCGMETTSVAPGRPVAPFERTSVDIGTLQTMMWDKLMLRVRSDASACR